MGDDKALTVIQIDPAALAVMPVFSIEAALERRNQVTTFIKRIMREGEDYGAIPGAGDKKTLLKPGAEKLTTFFGLTKRFSIVEQAVDWDKPFFYFHYRSQLYRGDLLIAEADGSCNSHEAKYRYRQGERVCPKCGKPNIRKSKKDNSWYCWTKTGGCGATFQGGDQAIEGQQVGRIENPDVADLVNTIQKMAQKRALVAAVLLAVNASEYFTQDVEDFDDGIVEGEVLKTKQEPPPPPDVPQGEGVEDPHQSLKVTAQKQNGNGHSKPAPARPLAPEQVRQGVLDRAAANTKAATEASKRNAVISLGKVVVGGDEVRHTLTDYLISKAHSEDFTEGECKALVAWVGANKENDWSANGYAIEEAKAILALMTSEGQLDLQLPADVEATFAEADKEAAQA